MHRDNDLNEPLILASASARRRDLLRRAGVRFAIVPPDVEETRRRGEPPTDYVRRLARDKAAEVQRRRLAAGDDRAVLGADTTVCLDDRVLGKPEDISAAREMLLALSGRTHEVLTGICLLVGSTVEQQVVRTAVTFGQLTAVEVERYLAIADWGDKAGAYAVQEHAAYMVREIQGSYTNVVGLPLAETVACLRRAGVIE